jgi:hypothetical protein
MRQLIVGMSLMLSLTILGIVEEAVVAEAADSSSVQVQDKLGEMDQRLKKLENIVEGTAVNDVAKKLGNIFLLLLVSMPIIIVIFAVALLMLWARIPTAVSDLANKLGETSYFKTLAQNLGTGSSIERLAKQFEADSSIDKIAKQLGTGSSIDKLAKQLDSASPPTALATIATQLEAVARGLGTNSPVDKLAKQLEAPASLNTVVTQLEALASNLGKQLGSDSHLSQVVTRLEALITNPRTSSGEGGEGNK